MKISLKALMRILTTAFGDSTIEVMSYHNKPALWIGVVMGRNMGALTFDMSDDTVINPTPKWEETIKKALDVATKSDSYMGNNGSHNNEQPSYADKV